MTTPPSPPRARISPLVLLAATCFTVSLATAADAAVAREHGLNLAARRSTQADHELVAAAKRLKACNDANRSQPRRCAAERAAVQHSGRRLASSEHRLAQLARETAHAHSAASWSGQRAPVLLVSGERLSWARIGSINSYVLARSVPGAATQYSVVWGTSTTPPPVPGVTVTYSIRTDVNGSAWSSRLSIGYPAAKPTPPVTQPKAPETTPPSETVDTQAAPAIVVTGEKLSWNAIPGVSAYVLASKVPGHAESFTEVSGTSITPPAVPGVTVHYNVRTAVDGSAWSPEVSITYQSATVSPPPPQETPPPPTESPAPSGGFEPGINSGTNPTLDVEGAAKLGARIVRIAFGIGESAAQMESVIAMYAAKGIRVAPLADFDGTMPSPAEAQNLAGWARAYGPGGSYWAKHGNGQLAVQTIEFGNETSQGYQYGNNAGEPAYQARAETYAVRVKEAAEAITASGVKVGVLATDEDWTGDWMNGMFAAVPNLGSYIAGWVTHPYGTGWRSKLETVVKQSAAHGAPASLPVDITEWGISSDNGLCLTENYGLNPCMTYQEAAETLRKEVAEIRAYLGSRQGLFLLYQVRDQSEPGQTNNREAYFGLLQHELKPKGAYTTAAEELLAI